MLGRGLGQNDEIYESVGGLQNVVFKTIGRYQKHHDGWRFVSFPLPGQYPGEGYHWPKNSQWRFSGDGVVHYPLKLKKLVITMPERVLYLTQYLPPLRPEIYLKDLMVTKWACSRLPLRLSAQPHQPAWRLSTVRTSGS